MVYTYHYHELHHVVGSRCDTLVDNFIMAASKTWRERNEECLTGLRQLADRAATKAAEQ